MRSLCSLWYSFQYNELESEACFWLQYSCFSGSQGARDTERGLL